MDEASGVRYDSAGRASRLHLSDNNTVTSEAGTIRTRAAMASGSTEYLSRSGADAALDFGGDGPYSVSLWLETGGSGAFQTAWSTFTAGISGAEVAIAASTNYLRFFGHATSGSAYLLGEYQASIAGAARHVVCTYDGSLVFAGLSVWVNGASVALTDLSTGSPSASASGDARVGARGSGSSFPLDGSVDELAIFNRVLTAREVAHLYNRGNGRRVA